MKTAENTGTKQRVQFDFTRDAYDSLEELQKKIKASTKAEVLRNALRLYEWLVNEIDPTSVVSVEDKEGNEIFRIPAKMLLS